MDHWSDGVSSEAIVFISSGTKKMVILSVQVNEDKTVGITTCGQGTWSILHKSGRLWIYIDMNLFCFS